MSVPSLTCNPGPGNINAPARSLLLALPKRGTKKTPRRRLAVAWERDPCRWEIPVVIARPCLGLSILIRGRESLGEPAKQGGREGLVLYGATFLTAYTVWGYPPIWLTTIAIQVHTVDVPPL